MTENTSPNTGLAEYIALEYILLGDLRDLLADPDDENTGAWLIAVLDALLDTLPREFRLKSEGGYLNEVLEQYPSWSNQIDDLRDEHLALYRKLHELRRYVAGESEQHGIAATLQEDLRRWMNRFTAHQRHERRLVQQAFTLEVGVGD